MELPDVAAGVDVLGFPNGDSFAAEFEAAPNVNAGVGADAGPVAGPFSSGALVGTDSSLGVASEGLLAVAAPPNRFVPPNGEAEEALLPNGFAFPKGVEAVAEEPNGLLVGLAAPAAEANGLGAADEDEAPPKPVKGEGAAAVLEEAGGGNRDVFGTVSVFVSVGADEEVAGNEGSVPKVEGAFFSLASFSDARVVEPFEGLGGGREKGDGAELPPKAAVGKLSVEGIERPNGLGFGAFASAVGFGVSASFVNGAGATLAAVPFVVAPPPPPKDQLSGISSAMPVLLAQLCKSASSASSPPASSSSIANRFGRLS